MARWRIPIYCKFSRQLVELAIRSTTERYNRIRDHLRRVFHSRDNLDGINSLKLCFFNAFKTFFFTTIISIELYIVADSINKDYLFNEKLIL